MSEASDDGTLRVVFDMGYYSENKAAIKEPIKEMDLSWQFLGREGGDTKGIYSGDDVSVFVLYTSDHADFTIRGDDEEKKQAILDAWSKMPTLDPDEVQAPTSPEEEAQSKEVRMWKFKKPTQRPGEPDALYERRLEGWKDKDPRT